RERPAGARHLGAPGLEREDCLVGLDRPLVRDVAVADRASVAAQVRVVDFELRKPEPAARVAGEYRRASAFRQRDPVALAAAAEALAAARPELDQPATGAELGREAQLEIARGDCGRQRRRGVHDEEVAWLEEPRQVAEGGVD